LTRQIALLAAPVLGLVILLKMQRTWRTWVFAVIPSVLGISLLLFYKWIRLGTGSGMGTFSSVGALIKGIGNYSLLHYYSRFGLLILYLGFIGFPLLLVFGRKWIKSFVENWKSMVPLAVFACISIYTARHFFPIGNIIEGIGIGPHLLKDVTLGSFHSQANENIWNGIYILSCASGTLLFCGLVVSGWQQVRNWRQADAFRLFLIALMAGEFAYLVINPIFFDRYTFILFVLVLIYVLRSNDFMSARRSIFVPVAALIIPLMSLSDFMDWQRSRANAASFLVEEMEVPRDKIDAGFEYNAWHRVAPIGEVSYDVKAKSWWFVDQDEYIVVSSASVEGYKAIKRFPVANRWLSPIDAVYVLKRTQ
jgi:branched-subunit amino acid transport protein AzlD